MSKNSKFLLDQCNRVYLSFFGTGFAPIAPGTVGSFAALPLLYVSFSFYQENTAAFYLLFFVLLALSCFLAESYQRRHSLHDPQWIVIDEVLGMFTTWFFFPTEKWPQLIGIFVLFRFFDIIKFWPASLFDRMSHGAGTILDDIISGIYAGGCYYLIANFSKFATL